MAEPRGPLASPGFWLHHAALAWRSIFDRRLRPLGLTPTQFMLLAAIGWLTNTTGQPPTQQEAAEQAGADRMMTSKVLAALTERGLVGREFDPADARLKRLRLTDAGREVVRQGIQVAVDLDEELFAPHPDLLTPLRDIAARAKVAGSLSRPFRFVHGPGSHPPARTG